LLQLGDRWADVLARERESGMGYQVVTIRLKDGRQFAGVTVVGGVINRVEGAQSIPFADGDIEHIVVTHDPTSASRG
jgi:hypothetical protein